MQCHFLALPVLVVVLAVHLIWHPLDLVLTSTGNSIVGAVVILPISGSGTAMTVVEMVVQTLAVLEGWHHQSCPHEIT